MQTEKLQMTDRDREIACLVVQGCETPEIAEQLSVTERTVKAHLGRLYLRAGIREGQKRVHLVNLLSAALDKSPLPALGNRERRVAELTIQGLTNSDISSRLEVSVQVVKKYLTTVFDKCGVWTRTELAARYRCD